MIEFMQRVPRDDYCINCNRERCVEIFTINNKPINYTLLLDKIERTKGAFEIDFSDKQLTKAMCLVCGKEYQLDWSSNIKIPRPFYLTELKNIMLDEFFNK